MKNTDEYEYKEILAELYDTEHLLLCNSFQSQDHIFSELFNLKIKRLVHKNVMKSKIIHFRNNAIALLGVFMIILAVWKPQVYVYAYQNVFEWCKDHYKVIFSDDSSLEKIPRFKFEYIPKGYTLIDSRCSNNLCYYLYENSKHETISIIITLADATENINNENTNYQEYIDSNGIKIYYLESTDCSYPSMITWTNNDLAYEIDGMISRDELEKIKNNIHKSED